MPNQFDGDIRKELGDIWKILNQSAEIFADLKRDIERRQTIVKAPLRRYKVTKAEYLSYSDGLTYPESEVYIACYDHYEARDLAKTHFLKEDDNSDPYSRADELLTVEPVGWEDE